MDRTFLVNISTVPLGSSLTATKQVYLAPWNLTTKVKIIAAKLGLLSTVYMPGTVQVLYIDYLI